MYCFNVSPFYEVDSNRRFQRIPVWIQQRESYAP